VPAATPPAMPYTCTAVKLVSLAHSLTLTILSRISCTRRRGLRGCWALSRPPSGPTHTRQLRPVALTAGTALLGAGEVGDPSEGGKLVLTGDVLAAV
jgi:hypothetical protein